MKLQRVGFFGNVEKATSILENAQEKWKEGKITKFDLTTIDYLISDDPNQQQQIANRKPLYRQEIDKKESQWKELISEVAESTKISIGKL